MVPAGSDGCSTRARLLHYSGADSATESGPTQPQTVGPIFTSTLDKMRVMVAMSGGVDSSVAAALLAERGHDVVGVTLKLWGGASDSGCCSVADVDDARRVAEQLGLDHHTFDLVSEFEEAVVGPYVDAHADGRTPNPCVECNRHIKFGKLLARARRLGFDYLATGHHARVDVVPGTPSDSASSDSASSDRWRLLRGVDEAKDQSYVLSMLTQRELAQLVLPVGDLTKAEVRERATALGLRTASKPDSQDVCFIHSASGRQRFLADRIELHPGVVTDGDGNRLGEVPAVELVTIGQRKGLGVSGGLGLGGLGSVAAGAHEGRNYAVEVDVPGRRVVVGSVDRLLSDRIRLGPPTWVDEPLPVGARALVQSSAHGRVFAAEYAGDQLVTDEPQRPVAAGQTVALYDPAEPDSVIGSALAA
jgi:tRNA-uridine 2-sulfurtransferase